jgi:hypothetical protein
MESPHTTFFNYHQYLISVQNLLYQSSGQYTFPSSENLLNYCYTHSPLFTYYTVFSQPPLDSLFQDQGFLNLALQFAQFHLDCVELLRQRGYVQTNEFEPSKLPSMSDFFEAVVQQLNSGYQITDVLRNPDFFKIIIQFANLVADEFTFIVNFSQQIRVVDNSFNSFIEQFRSQISQIGALAQRVEDRALVIYDLIQSLIFLGVPFIPQYETFAWATRDMVDIFSFEHFIVTEYLQAINNRLSENQIGQVVTWYQTNSGAGVEIPLLQESMSLMDVIFLQAMNTAFHLYHYSTLDQLATYIQARFEVDVGGATIILGYYYNAELHKWIDSLELGKNPGILQLITKPPSTIPMAKRPARGQQPDSTSPKSQLPNQISGDPIFVETAGDFGPPKLPEIERILKIITGDAK